MKVICKRSKAPPLTADAACIAIDDISQDRFLCKDNLKVAWLPLAEWVAQKLARKCGVLVPDCFIVELESNPGVEMFGSRWEGGAEAYSHGIIGKVTNPEQFSFIYVFDLLIHNLDRHLNNYLYLQLAGDTVVKAMDHSQCFWQSGWPIPAPPVPPFSNTVRAKVTWSRQVMWDTPGAASVIDNWKKISQLEIEEIVNSAPAAWVTAQMRQDIVGWWGTANWATRTNLVSKLLP